jgi:tetratricopeptide (TPR) repeat protein
MAKFDSPYNEIYLRLVSRFKNILEDQRKEGDRRRWINAPNRQQTPGFVGRNEILQKMHDYFHPVDTRDGKSPAENEEEESQTEMGGVFVLHGSPDLGKTRIALQYATKHDKSYSKIVWVRAGSSYEVLDSFRLAARSLELESPERGLIGAVFSKLSEIDGKILIVYDDLDVNMSALIHTEHERQWGPSTHVIITTNDRLSVRSLQVCATHVINSLSASEGHKLMRTMLHFQNSESDSDLTRLGEALGWHPLAIQQSVSYIDISALSVDRYLSTLSRAPKDVLFSELGYIDTGKSLEATFEQLLKRLGADDSFAVDWVSMCSYLGTKIDHDLFDLAQDFWSSGPVRAQESNAFSPTSDGWAELSWLFSDPSRSLESMWLRLSALGRFNVVKTHSTYWELPTLMALWIRHRHGDAPGQKHKHLARAVCFLHACAEQLRRAGAGNARRDTAAAYNAQLRLVHLANVCVRHCSDAIKKNIASIVPVECTVTLACWKIHAGDCNSAVDMLTVALDRETNPLSMIDLQRTLAWGLRRGCRAAEAVPYQLLAIESLERLQASNAASTADCVYEVLRARGELASIYREVPKKLKLNDAIELQKGIVTQTRELYGDNARQTIHEMSCLSSIYSTAVQLEKALAIDLEILEICRESRTSLEELMSQKEKLAVTYFDLHRFKDAIELQTEVMEWCRERYGEQHIETATALHRLAASRLHAEFELPLAHKMISSALDIRRKWLGDENDRTKKSAKLKEEIKKKQESIRHSGTVSRRVDSFNRGLEHRDSGFAM